MNFRYRLDDLDMVRAMKLHSNISLYGVVALAVAGCIVIGTSMYMHSNFIIIIGAIMIVIAISLPFSTAKNAKQQFDENRGFRCETSCELTAAGINFENEMGLSKLGWEDIKTWKSNDDVLIIYISSHCFHVVPVRAIPDFNSFKDQLSNKIGQKCA